MTKSVLHTVYLCLGTNLGDKVANLTRAIEHISECCGEVCRKSSIYLSSAWGYNSENEFYNQCLKIETHFEADELIDRLLSIEENMGRVRESTDYKDRIMDIDILFFDDLVIQTDKLIVPHPRIGERRFVLAPMKELSPDHIHPLTEKTICELLEVCKDKSVVISL